MDQKIELILLKAVLFCSL